MATNYSPRIVTDGLVLCLDAANPKSYPGSGTTWSDLSGNGNDGTLTNGPTYSSDNKGSIVFDGTNDIVTVPMSGLRPSYITQECWFNSDAIASQVFIGSQYGTSSGNSYALWLSSSIWRMGVNIGGTFITRSYTGVTFQTNTWYHFAATYDGNNEIMYINGLQVDSYARSGPIAYNTNNTLLAIGNDWNGSGYDNGASVSVHGKMPLVKIYNRGLTADEISQNFQATRGRYGI